MKTFVIEFLFMIKIIFSLRIESKIDELSSKISDKEIDELLKDPKYQKLADTDISLDLELSSSIKPTKKEEHYFDSFKFISKEKLKELLKQLNEPLYSSYLPREAKLLIEKTLSNDISFANNNQINSYIDTSLANSFYTEGFIDPDGVISRKGILTLIDKGKNELAYAVANSKVFILYSTENKENIIKIYRNSKITIKDIVSSPCFNVISKNENNLICAPSNDEKDLWIKTITSHLTNNTS